MATEVVMPQMGESIAEGTITKWLVQVGERVERDQPLFEISTDKVDAEIPSPVAGVLLEIRHQAGETIAVQEVVATIGAEGENAAAAPAAAAEPVIEEAAPTAAAGSASEEAAAAPAAAPPAVAESAAAPVDPAPPSAPVAAAGSLEERVRTLSSPLVRNIAREHQIDLAQVPGTGIHGRVTKQDILGFIEKGKAAPAAPAATPAPSGKIDPGFHVAAYTASEEVVIEPMSRIRKITAAHMRYSKDTSAHVSTVFHMDFTKVDRIRARAKRGFQEANGTKLSYMPFIFK
ncbi:MAG TPA: biotin/lipoyl-containing protein, partial [Thermoanaerobaculia bacterium]|nr:biotin/lipoyl-containing protein [Thermoanaerobaculia bacterium]